MQTMRNLILVLFIFSLGWGCTQRDAATLGAVVGRTVAMPIGTAAVILDETVQSTGDIVRQNPRYDNLSAKPSVLNHSRPAPPTAFTPVAGYRKASYVNYNGGDTYGDSQTHYYRAEVLVKTRGPADIESINFAESQDITEFWN